MTSGPKRRPPRARSGPAGHAPSRTERGEWLNATLLFVVDRREGDFLVLVDEAGTAIAVERDRIAPANRVDGAVLRVPFDSEGSPRWSDAVRDRDEEDRRLDEARARVERLRRSDPGGDVAL